MNPSFPKFVRFHLNVEFRRAEVLSISPGTSDLAVNVADVLRGMFLLSRSTGVLHKHPSPLIFNAYNNH